MSEILQRWLRGGASYTEGLKILELQRPAHGDLVLMRMGESPYTLQLLKQALTELADAAPISAEVRIKKHDEKITERPKVERSAYPKEMHQVIARQDSLYALVNHLHPQLGYLYKTDRVAHTGACHKIVEAWAEIKNIYRILDYWREHRVVLKNPYSEEVQEDELPVPLLVKRRNTLRTYLSRSKGDPLKFSKIKAWEKELREIELKLDQHAF